MERAIKTATLAGGCFWCLEAVFNRVKGVEQVRSGYTGGKTPHPTYREVCSGATGHAEAVQISFDPAVISFRELLDIFWHIHDPTTPNRQGADVGSQYRSAIFYHDDEQKAEAEDSIRAAEASGIWEGPFVTELVPLNGFFPAEEYHHDYYRLNPDQPYCRIVIDPKIRKLMKNFPHRLK